MVYLIESAGYNKTSDGKLEYFQLLKIGYTDDKGKDRRYSQYKLHNPTCEVLFEIPFGTEDHEFRIQYKFRNLQYKEYGREWFKYSEEIVDFFKNIKSLEDIENNLPKSINRKYLERKKEIKKIVRYIHPLNPKDCDYDFDGKIKEKLKNYFDKLIDDLGDKIKDPQNVLDYLKKDFGESRVDNYLKIRKSIDSKIFTEDTSLNKIVVDFLDKFKNLPTMYEKLKSLCESGLSKEAISVVLDQLPDSDEIKSFYNTLGPDRLKSLGYNKTNIKRELGVLMFNPLLLQHHIYQDFKEGDKVLLSDAKCKLASIYSEINYSKSPKAVDLEEFFEVKEFMARIVVNGERKRVRGYELLKKKFEDNNLEEKLGD